MIKSKCCDSDIFIEKKGSQVGIYCSKCGKWQKWANKDETRLFMKDFSQKKDEVFQFESKLSDKENYYKIKLNKLWKDAEYMIDKEMSVLPLSFEDSIRKSTKCATLEGLKIEIEEILKGAE